MRLPCRFLGQQHACRWSAASVSPRIQISDEIVSPRRRSEVHPCCSVRPRKPGDATSVGLTHMVEWWGEMGVVITTGLSNCWAALTQRSLHTNTSSSQQQQITQWTTHPWSPRDVRMTVASNWRAAPRCDVRAQSRPAGGSSWPKPGS